MAKYQCFIDLGSSGTKAVLNDGERFYSYQCPPLVADMPPSELMIIEAQGEQLGSGLESVGYLQLDPETPAYALGIDAQGRPNKATSSLPKSALAHIRALGVIGEFAHRHELERLTLDVGIALPFNEYLADYRALTAEILGHKMFTYRGKDIFLDFGNVKVLPEAAGLVQWRKVQRSQQKERGNKTFVVLMFGHRDLSFLLFNGGRPPQGEPSSTERLGYQQLLKAVAQDLPCNSDDPFLYDALISNAARVVFPNRPKKGYSLAERREKATAYYWELVQYRLNEWLASVSVPNYEVLISGGTAIQLRERLEEYFEERTTFCTVNWLEDLQNEVAANLEIDSEIDQLRFSDCYGGAKWLALKFQKITAGRSHG
ncbi:ParM/StbA family protein [Leptothoe sp. PORK10 BA2]|uniref:ParM/StbA family protein n=1 Tax=Leptothoe sp. PORK10 BA2 TaxID=3110254 RepID=UPI002B202CBC|nr:ParM/StbA family protein [Leptothoe sp. PORK10 BA2]MEA5463387.1 ParM/StbA family protein [Leptothoe sp. PORK10 BA2]